MESRIAPHSLARARASSRRMGTTKGSAILNGVDSHQARWSATLLRREVSANWRGNVEEPAAMR